MHGVGNAVGFSVPGWIMRADLGSNLKRVSVCLPPASVLTAETAAGLPRTEGFHHSSHRFGSGPSKAGCLQDNGFTDLIFSLFLIPHTDGEPAAGFLHVPSLARASPASQA